MHQSLRKLLKSRMLDNLGLQKGCIYKKKKKKLHTMNLT